MGLYSHGHLKSSHMYAVRTVKCRVDVEYPLTGALKLWIVSLARNDRRRGVVEGPSRDDAAR